jgi:hypothetical protein
MNDGKDFQTIDVVYLGLVRVAGGGSGHSFIPAATLAECGDNFELARKMGRIFSGKGVKGRTVGAVYSVEAVQTADVLHTMRFGTMAYGGRSDSPLVPAFELKTAGIEREDRLARLEKKAKANPAVMAEVRELALFLNRLPTMERFAAEAALFDLIRREASNLRKVSK